MQNLNSLGQFDYTTDYSKSNFAGIWEKGYALIANVNTLLKNADEKKNLFTGDQYNWITGEAYALRAMLHFDLLRLFGPVYKTNKEDVPFLITKNLYCPVRICCQLRKYWNMLLMI